MEYDFENICRVCMATGVMMSIFKVNISKKIMACASVQVSYENIFPTLFSHYFKQVNAIEFFRILVKIMRRA